MHTQEIIKSSCHCIGEKENLGSEETCSLNIQAGLGTTALVNCNYALASNTCIYTTVSFRIFGFLGPFMKSQTLNPILLFYCFPPLISYMIRIEKMFAGYTQTPTYLLIPALSLYPNVLLSFISRVPIAFNPPPEVSSAEDQQYCKILPTHSRFRKWSKSINF